MSLRYLGTRLFKYGADIAKNAIRRNINTVTINNAINVVPQTAPTQAQTSQRLPRHFALRNVGVQIGLQARRILIDNVLNRVTNSLAAELRKKAIRRILYGDSGPFFALVGVSLASETGILTKEEELEGVCWEIKEAISKIKWHYFDVNVKNENVTLDDIALGKPIAKGTNGVVYSAKLKTNDIIDKNNKEDDSISSYPFALKMIFNYDIQSNSMAILKGMYRETVPARLYYNNLGEMDWETELSTKKKSCPPHPNIVAMFSVFVDYIRDFEDSKSLYPAALPPRLHPDGIGRNMSLFLLMKRYETNLHDYLKTDPTLRTRIQIFAQLLEGVAHLNAHQIAHRDLKSDNLLLDISEKVPILVISDFGCCLADKDNGLMLPYTSDAVDKLGNMALQPPEIINQKPGTFSVLNYTRSDLWSAGAIAYEIFGCNNPFYGKKSLRSHNYEEEQLPKLPQEIPVVIRELVKNLLRRNPNKRLHPELAANVVQIFLWAPSSWLKPDMKIPTSAEILQWLLSLTTKILCEGRVNNASNNMGSRRTYPEYLLISSFLCRVKLTNIRSALSWIQDNNYELDY